MKPTKNILMLSALILGLLLPVTANAKTIHELPDTDSKDYTVIMGYDEEDKEEIFDSLTDEEKDKFLENKTKEVYNYLSRGEMEKIEQMRRENPKLTIIIQKNFLETNTNSLKNNSLVYTSELKTNTPIPYSYDTDTYVRNKSFRVSNNSGLAFAEGVAKVTVNRNLSTRNVTIVGINVSINRSKGKFGFTPVYNGNNTARLAWTYLGLDSYGNGNIRFKAYFNKTVDMY